MKHKAKVPAAYSLLLITLAVMTSLPVSCTSKNDRKKAAVIGEEIISTNTIDKIIEEELYSHLCEIYDARVEATREYLSMMLLKKAADEEGISVAQLTSRYSDTEDGTIDEQKANSLIDSLYDKYGVSITLKEPIAPRVNIDSAIFHSRGNLDSRIVFLELSDYECGMCNYMHKEYKKLLDHYGKDVKFVHSNYSSRVTPEARAAIAASMQDKFWEMSDTLMSLNRDADSSQVMRIAAGLNLDMEQFVNDYASKETLTAISGNNEYLSRQGIRQTPTLILNGRKIRKPNDIEYVEQKIKEAIDENN